MSVQQREITIEIISDAICPWCWIGKRNLERAAERLGPEIMVKTIWKPFELNPDMPPEGVPREAYRQHKFGSLAFSRQLDAQVAEKGRAAGLTFRHDLMKWTPNTRDCHRLIRFAGQDGRQDAVVEGLFRAYFAEGRNIGDHDVMVELAEAAGLERGEVAEMLATGAEGEAVDRELTEARTAGISGVPTFVLDGSPAISGAAPPETLILTLTETACKIGKG